MELKPGYKQTEVGVIPEDWDAHRLKSFTTVVASGKSKHSRALGTYPVHGSTGIIGYTESPEYEGDAILVARVGANAGKLNVVSGRYGVTDNTIMLRLNSDTSPSFMRWILEAKRLNSLVFGSGQPLITGSQLKALTLAIPPLEEQCAIATALSDMDALLDGLDRLIAKKRDIKQAAMQQLLTGETRLPGFEGEWEIKKLEDVGCCLRGVSYRGDSDLSTHDTAQTKRLLRSNNVQNAVVVTSEVQFVNTARVSSNQVLKNNDILVCMANGSKALVGKAGFFAVEDGYE